jgi:outer membrane protein assembly factor BamB
MRIASLAAIAAALLAEDWPGHRGAARDGVYKGAVRTDWAERSPRLKWKIAVGDGYAGVSIADGKVFTVEQRGKKQEAATAYSLETGKELWVNAWDAGFSSFLGGNGPRSTPTFDEGRIYVQGAEGELRCLDANSGKTIWRKNILRESGGKGAAYGVSISPLVVKDKLVTQAGGTSGNTMAAYNKLTGATIWTALDDGPGYSSPMFVELAGVAQILTFTGKRAVGLNPGNGAVLWSHPWRTSFDVNAAQPVAVGPNRVLLSSGYGHGAAVIEIAKSGEVKAIWENKLLKNKFSSSVFHEGFLYGLDENIFSCVDAAAGERKWKAGRYGYGQVLLLAAEGHLIVTAESGEVVLLRADPAQLREIARFQALEGKTWNQPAIGGAGILVLRNEKQMAAFEIGR